MFLSDHGNHMSPFMKMTSSGIIEMYNPGLFLILPRKMADKYRDVLKKNE